MPFQSGLNFFASFLVFKFILDDFKYYEVKLKKISKLKIHKIKLIFTTKTLYHSR